ncbi:EAL domain-containing protein [Laribacter hongkongensis]|uniref:sensor domain-containing protein n=1 Tax=Laribacter hongkongensis TaxID=168471 RepID=UPI001EFD819A|nr:EAL domain-containing protein [Laribacter hongkongensis]MCG8991957.1 EAL domain-containing protein [Laribacter hongkongensis]MCG8997850.1 EAL domain-containing protein [Laribacter hongkongensis]MCG9000473.1 EAL domain-containing protein [Laribacter hongkongensis]MCG9003007.1 EAL domain-containing protein [Laribacter hongkongensis]MCG9006333.1 EAL domain-containing protein [Laribacter hongkongensis]
MFYSSLPECENGVWWLAASGEVLHANDAAARLTRGCYDHPAFGQLANMHLSSDSERLAWMLPQAGGGEQTVWVQVDRLPDGSLMVHQLGTTSLDPVYCINEDRFRYCFEHLPFGLLVFDQTGRVMVCNRHFDTMMGLSEEAVHGLDLTAMPVPEFSRAVRQALAGDVGHFFGEIPVAGGTRQLGVRAVFAPLLTPSGQVPRGVAILEDALANSRWQDELLAGRRRRQLFLDQSVLAAIEWDDGFCVQEWNRAAERMFGFSREEAIGQHAFFILPSEVRATLDREVLQCLMRQEGGWHSVNVNQTRDGALIQCEWFNTTLVDSNGKSLGVTSLVLDITEKQAREDELRVAAQVYEQSREGILITDAQHRIVMLNSRCCELTGYTQGEVVGTTPEWMFSESQVSTPGFVELCSHLDEQGGWAGELLLRQRNGQLFLAWMTLRTVRLGTSTYHVCMFGDLSDRQAAERRIQYLAYFDTLTGLPNRALLTDRANMALRSVEGDAAPALALLLLDIDHFKHINDTLGHSTGDQLLQSVAKRLQATVREGDTVSRQGGDEFVVLLPDANASRAASVAQEILRRLGFVCRIGEHDISVSVSIGIAMAPDDGTDFATLSKCAEIAMYRAKQEGRNTLRFFFPEMQERTLRHVQLTGALRGAVERGEMQLHYQPQVDLQTGELSGVEALLRWTHPLFGAVSPGEFIPLAEESGLIIPIGDWVLRTAARQLADWLRDGLPPMVMAVNLSVLQFNLPGLAQQIASILSEAGVPPALFEVELTESMAMTEPEAAIATIDELHSVGVQVSLDDFGTGYSSLAYLKRFRLDRLKIDGSFVRDADSDPEDRAIVDAIVGMAESLGLATVAEGVETSGQLEVIRALGGDAVQGYWISRPLPAAGLVAWLEGWQQRKSASPCCAGQV